MGAKKRRVATYQARTFGSFSNAELLVRRFERPTATILRSFIGTFWTSGRSTGKTCPKSLEN